MALRKQDITASKESVGYSLNFSDHALEVISDNADFDAGSLVLWLTAVGWLEMAENQDDEDDEQYYEQDADYVA
jgi:hypothetical protein